jgi:CBS domain-containing protein
MAQKVRNVMTKNVVTVPDDDTVLAAARKMKENDIGDVIVTKHGKMCGIVTDRDIVIRTIAEQSDPARTAVGTICSRDVTSVGPDAEVDDAIRIMREKAIRRLPVTDDGRPVGIVTLGDLAQARDPGSALGEISARPPNN